MGKYRPGLFLLLSLFLLIICLGCQSNQDQIYSQALEDSQSAYVAASEDSGFNNQSSSSSGGDSQAKILKITTPLPSVALQKNAERYMAEHPGITVVLDVRFPDLATIPSNWAEQYVEQITVELAGGDVADIVDLGMVSLYKYTDSGMFENLYDYMEHDATFQMEDYYTNIYSAIECEDGTLPVIPPFFNYYTIIFNDYILREIGIDASEDFADGIDFDTTVSLFQKAVNAGVVDEETLFAEDSNKTFFDIFELATFVNLPERTATLNSPEFIEYLETVNQLPFDRTISQGMDFSFNFPKFSPSSSFCQLYGVLTSMFGEISAGAQFGRTEPIFYNARNGAHVFVATVLLSIPSSGDQKNIAWDFLCYVIEEKDFGETEGLTMTELDDIQMEQQQFYGSSIPINRKNFEKICSLFGKVGPRWFQQYDNYNHKLNSLSFSDYTLQDQLGEIQAAYLDNHLITAEECTKQMQERAEIYLNE